MRDYELRMSEVHITRFDNDVIICPVRAPRRHERE